MPPLRAALSAAFLAAAAHAQTPPSAKTVPDPPVDWSPPDPSEWWTAPWPKPPEAAEPLGPRRLGRGERLASIDNGVSPDLYRLWALQPLQGRIIRGDEAIIEIWLRPSRSVRQSVVRITMRRDGEAFVQARAGLACCEPGIARRVGFDARLEPGAAAQFRALRALPIWNAPRDVIVDEGGGASDAVCVDGAAYDLTLLTPGRARHVRRACDNAAIGEAADILQPVLAAALGREPRIDVVLAPAADLSAARSAYAALIRDGGRLKPSPQSRVQPSDLDGVEGAEPEKQPSPQPG